MGSAHPKYSGPTLPQGTNAVSDFIPVARISDLLLQPGETVDFVVGNGADNLWGDNTPVIVTIQSPVPEPESGALMAGGLALLARLRRRSGRR